MVCKYCNIYRSLNQHHPFFYSADSSISTHERSILKCFETEAHIPMQILCTLKRTLVGKMICWICKITYPEFSFGIVTISLYQKNCNVWLDFKGTFAHSSVHLIHLFLMKFHYTPCHIEHHHRIHKFPNPNFLK